MSKSRIRLIQISIFAALFGYWHYATSTGIISPLFLPNLPALGAAFVEIIVSGRFIHPLRVTLTELVFAYTNAVVAGTLAGFWISRSKFWMRVIEPILSSIFAVPLVIFYPLALLFFGLGVESKIAFGTVMGFFPIVLNTISGFGHVDSIYERAAHSMGAKGFKLFWRVLLPAALPIILTGYRIGFILCFLSILGGEALGSFEGLGHEIVFFAESMQSNMMFAFIVFIVIISFILNSLVFWIERKNSYQK